VNPKHEREFARAIGNGQYEQDDQGGLYLPRQRVSIGGVFESEVWRNGECIAPPEPSHNKIVDEALNKVFLDAIFGQNSETPVYPWFVSVYTANQAPAASWDYENYPTNATEITAAQITGSSRPAYTVNGPSTTQSISNSNSKATFTIDTGQSATVYGAAVLSVSTLGETSNAAGRLLAASLFTTARALSAGDDLLVTYTINASSST
jgi:hypothetical protein